MRDVLFKRMARKGLIRLHWVTEFTKKQRPHLHIAAFFDGSDLDAPDQVARHWIEIAGQYRPRPVGQLAKPMSDAAGWFGYVAKHASRGVDHYQRGADDLPPSWQSSGRLWGTSGPWETSSEALTLSFEAFHRLRRLTRSWAISQARADLAKAVRYQNPAQMRAARRRISRARAMLTCTDAKRSALIGLGQWIPEKVQRGLIAAALVGSPPCPSHSLLSEPPSPAREE